MVLRPCSSRGDGNATPASPGLVRVDARWGSFGLGSEGELRLGGDAIVVTAARGRRTGYGAAATLESRLGDGLEWIFRNSAELVQLTDVRAMWAFGRRRRATIGTLPAAWAAVELALIDLFARESGRAVSALLGETPAERSLPRTAVVTDEVGRDLEDVVAAASDAGIVEFTLRVCGNRHRDRARLEAIRAHVPTARVRLRCDGLFRDLKQGYAYLAPLVRSFWAFEGVGNDDKSIGELVKALGRPVVITDPAAVHAMTSKKIPWVAELDLARAGGLLRAMELGRAARAADRPVVLGTPTSTHPTEAEAYRILATFVK